MFGVCSVVEVYHDKRPVELREGVLYLSLQPVFLDLSALQEGLHFSQFQCHCLQLQYIRTLILCSYIFLLAYTLHLSFTVQLSATSQHQSVPLNGIHSLRHVRGVVQFTHPVLRPLHCQSLPVPCCRRGALGERILRFLIRHEAPFTGTWLQLLTSAEDRHTLTTFYYFTLPLWCVWHRLSLLA